MKPMKAIALLLVVFTLAGCLTACQSREPNDQENTGLDNVTSEAWMEVGETHRTTWFDDPTVTGMKFYNLNDDVLEVSCDGRTVSYTAKKVGQSVVTFIYNGAIVDRCLVTVHEVGWFEKQPKELD
jgi:hypothetical protein